MSYLETLPAPVPHPKSRNTDRLKRLVLDSVTSRESKRAYDRAITDFLMWCSTAASITGFTKATVQAYKTHLVQQALSASTINVRMRPSAALLPKPPTTTSWTRTLLPASVE